jgi:hypothetical protein
MMESAACFSGVKAIHRYGEHRMHQSVRISHKWQPGGEKGRHRNPHRDDRVPSRVQREGKTGKPNLCEESLEDRQIDRPSPPFCQRGTRTGERATGAPHAITRASVERVLAMAAVT